MNKRENHRTALAAVVGLATVGLFLLPLTACNTGDLLNVEDPDIVTPSSLSGETGLNTLYTGAVGDFELGYQGGTGGGSFPDAVVTASALMSDEMYLSGTFPTRTEFDQRSIDVKNGTLNGMFFRLQRARASTAAAATAIEAASSSDPRVGELLAMNGFAKLGFAENYCSGVPFSTVAESGELQYGNPQSTDEILADAVSTFDNAISAAAGDDEIANLARVGKARAQLDQGNFADAATTVAAVPTDFVYNLAPSINSSVSGRSVENGVYSANTAQRRLSVADQDGGTGLAFRSGDPRVPVEENAQGGFDSTSPQWNLLAFAQTGEVLAREATFPLATGIEARLIEAEAALQNGDGPGMVQILNDLRTMEPGLSPLSDPGTAASRRDMLFQERAFWLYATGHRLSDLRRLVRQYGRSADAVFPSGAYFKGGNYGSDVNYPIPFNEQNNPNFTQCTNRDA